MIVAGNTEFAVCLPGCHSNSGTWHRCSCDLDNISVSPRRDFAMCMTGPNQFYILGGFSGSGTLCDCHIANLTWKIDSTRGDKEPVHCPSQDWNQSTPRRPLKTHFAVSRSAWSPCGLVRIHPSSRSHRSMASCSIASHCSIPCSLKHHCVIWRLQTLFRLHKRGVDAEHRHIPMDPGTQHRYPLFCPCTLPCSGVYPLGHAPCA